MQVGTTTVTTPGIPLNAREVGVAAQYARTQVANPAFRELDSSTKFPLQSSFRGRLRISQSGLCHEIGKLPHDA
jgi:hypothetical protein